LIKEYNPDFISAHFGYPVGVWLSSLKPVPKFLITCHGPALNETARGPRARYGIDGLLADSMNKSAGAVAISADARRIMEKIGVKSSKILDIRNGVDCKKFRKAVGFDLRAKFGIPEDALVILSVGRGILVKAYDDGIKAFANVAHKMPKIYYIILGAGTDMWLPLAEQLGLKKRVIFCQGLYGDDLIGAYQQSDIFFLPSIKELGPLVVMEAMAAGLPEVVTNISGSQDMIHKGVNGIVVEPGAIDEMAEALNRLATNEALRQRFGQANLEKSKYYDWNVISREYLKHA
jgi:glycosyltransferase involved in cell wall biosynthesis